VKFIDLKMGLIGLAMLKPNFENIPQVLKTFPHWVAFNGKKVPINPKTGSPAKAGRPETWANYEVALEFYQARKNNGVRGVGFQFHIDDPFMGIDLDKVRNPGTGEIEPWAMEIVHELKSYTEISPSGTGLHILVEAKLPPGGRRKGQLELYDSARFFTVTGHHLPGTPNTIEYRQNEIDKIYQKYWRTTKSEKQITHPEDHNISSKGNGDAFDLNEYVQKNLGEINPEAEPDWPMIEAFKEYDPDFELVWDRKRPGFGDDDSRFELSIANRLARVVMVDRSIADLQPSDVHRLRDVLIWWGAYKRLRQISKPAKRKDYLISTISLALSSALGLSGDDNLSQFSPDMEKTSKNHLKKRNDTLLSPLPLFPIEIFPVTYLRAIFEISKAYGVPIEIPACALISAAGACIGRIRGILIKQGWIEHGNLWIAIIGESGMGKSPATKPIFRPIFKKEKIWNDEFKEALRKYEVALKEYEDKRKTNKGESLPPPEGPPKCEQLLVDDITLESLTDALDSNPRGILQARDELSGLIQDLDRYSPKDGGSKSRYMSSYDSGPWKVNRKNKKAPSFIPNACLSIFGTIQPKALSTIFKDIDTATGFLPRFLMVRANQTTPPFWTDETVSQQVHQDLAILVDKLLNYEFSIDGEPLVIGVSLKAKSIYRDWYNQQVAEPWQDADEKIYEAVLAKLRGQCLRLALILHCLQAAENNYSELTAVTEETMKRAIIIANWFKEHQKYAWQFLNADSIKEMTPVQKLVMKVILQLEGQIVDGMLATQDITQAVNEKLELKAHLSSKSIGKTLASLGLKKAHLPDKSKRGFTITNIDMERFKAILGRSVAHEDNVQEDEDENDTEKESASTQANHGDKNENCSGTFGTFGDVNMPTKTSCDIEGLDVSDVSDVCSEKNNSIPPDFFDSLIAGEKIAI
jgi:hypothetical protein